MQNKKRGFTLVELCIVMALVAVVAAMTVSFFLLTNRHTDEAKKEYQVLSDLSDIEQQITAWIRTYDSYDYQISLGSDNKSLIACPTEDLSYSASRMYFSFTNDLDRLVNEKDSAIYKAFALDRIIDAFITEEQKASDYGRRLFKCNVTYLTPDGNENEREFFFTTRCTISKKTSTIIEGREFFKRLNDGKEASGGEPNGTPNHGYEQDRISKNDTFTDYNSITKLRNVEKIVFDYNDEHQDIVDYYLENNIEAVLMSEESSESKAYAYFSQDGKTLYVLTDPGTEMYATNMTRMFFGFTSLKDIESNNFHTDNVTSLVRTFEGTAIENLDFMQDWVLDDIESFFYTFIDCTHLQNATLHFTSSSAGCNFNSMFYNCTSLEKIDFSDCYFKTSAAGDAMQYMFEHCNALETIIFPDDVDTSLTTSYWRTFANCTELESIVNLDKFSNENAFYYSHMFENCTSLKEIDLSGFMTPPLYVQGNPDKRLRFGFMFLNCSSLEHIYTNIYFDLSSIDEKYLRKDDNPANDMFNGCEKLVGGADTTFSEYTEYMSNHGVPGQSSMAELYFARIDGGADSPGLFTQS